MVNVPLVFLALAAIFTALALRDSLRGTPGLTPRRKAYLTVAFFFAAVPLLLALLNAVR